MVVHPAEPRTTRYEVDRGSGVSFAVLNVGLACCAVEFVAASLRRQGLRFVEAGDPGDRPTPDAHLLVVSGTVTDKLAPSVLRLYEGLPDPSYVLSFGSCANSGGPYWDSYCVTKGVDQLIPVDVYVPGCPPRPEALLEALRRLEERVLAGAS